MYCDHCSNKGTAVCLDCRSDDGVPDHWEEVAQNE